MNGRWDNIYAEHLVSDHDLCVPVLPPDRLDVILWLTSRMADSMVGRGPKPKVTYDLEHLQVADYTTFPLVTQPQKDKIRRLSGTHPIRTDEMAFLALRSMIGLFWDEPKSEDDIRRAAAYDKALETVLVNISAHIGNKLSRQDSLLPYWGRLSFLRVMTTIPDEQIEAHDLDRIACILLKDPAFNARSFRYGNFDLVGANYALEPILKGLNRMLLHFLHTEPMSGEKRMERVWNSLVPVVAYFWARGAVAANQLSPLHTLFDESMIFQAQALTASQVDFIMRHEIGHLVLDHAQQLQAIADDADAKRTLRHEFELSADAFAQGSIRSALYNHLRVDLQWESGADALDDDDSSTTSPEALHEYQAEISRVRLLFAYMDVIDKAGRLLKDRLGTPINFRASLDSHPSPDDRLNRLNEFHIAEHAPTSKLLRYADDLFDSVLSYAEDLPDGELSAPLNGLY